MKSRKSDQLKRQSKHKQGDGHRKALRNALRTFETLEERQLLTVQPIDGFFYPPIGVHTAYLPADVSYEEYAELSAQQYGGQSGSGGLSGEGTQGFTTVNENEDNDIFSQAEFVNLGTAADQNDGVAIVGNLNALPGTLGPQVDEDYFRVNLRRGDIIDASATGGILARYDVSFFDSNFQEVIGNQNPIAVGYPIPDSPLSTGSNTNLAFVVPEDGTYFVRIAEANQLVPPTPILPYTLTLRASRSPLLAEPVGTVQKIFLDFDGQILRRDIFGAFGNARLSPLSSFLAGWGLQPQDEDRVIDKIIDVFASKFYGATAVSGTGGNGDYFSTGKAGEFGLQILNSRDHADPFTDPFVSRIVIGGTQAELAVPTIGIAQSIDVGNFDTTETAVVLLDSILPSWGGIPRAANVPLEDILTEAVGAVAAHEAGHFFGAWHTLNTNASNQIMDTGGNFAGLVGVGPDGVFGTPDDEDVQFGTDTYDPNTSAIQFGRQDSAGLVAFGLSSGTTGGASINGTVFHDRNVNRALDSADLGLSQVQVYADTNNNSVLDSGEFFATSQADGTYTLDLPPGTYVIREVVPSGFRLTTPDGVSINAGANQTFSNINFGNEKLNPIITGTKFNDINGNGLRDGGENGIEGVWIYFDQDGDNRLDIGEPATQTGPDGTYQLTFPGPGVYSIREVVEPGYIQTFPGVSDDGDPLNDFEHTVVITGDPVIDASRIAGLDFGNQLTVDFGDAPQSYGEASHGFLPGLILGTNWDAEQGSQFSAAANGDDNNGAQDSTGAVIDDEDGIVLTRPLVAGSTTNRISVTTQNTSGLTGFLHGWVDFNQDGDFSDAGEHVISNTALGTGTNNVTFTAPTGALLGNTLARFRYTNDQNIGPTGNVTSGEVEDYVFSVVETLDLAVDDRFSVSRNSALNSLDVLANDFRLPGEVLEIISVGGTQAGGIVQISNSGTLLYTPPNGFIGQDVFTYQMRNSVGDVDTATVVVDVSLFFENPQAIDDSFNVATNSIDFPLNVLANDIEGQNGALTIISVTQPNQGGQISIATGGKSLRYTPPRNFGGTEVFSYTVADSGGNQSTASVTLHTLPGDRNDDDVLIQLVATDLTGTPITAIQQGQDFRIEVHVDDLRFDSSNPGTAAGVFGAYADLLYDLQLVSTVADNDPNSNFNFEVSFFNDYANFQTGNATIPGIIDEFGAFSNRPVINDPDPVLMAAITFSARSPGIANFTPDPADNFPDSDTLLFDTPGTAIPIEKIRYIGTSLEIVGDGVEFPVAVDDSVPQTIPAGTVGFPIDVLANDRPGSTGQISLESVTSGLFGSTTIDTRGTADPADDRVLYTPNGGFNGADQFTYTIQDIRGIQSTARVTVRVGAADDNDIVALRLSATDLNGQPIDEVTVGSQFQLRGFVQDIRGFGTDRGVFAAYEDVIYSADLVSPVASNTNDPDLGFQVQFGPNYQRVREGDIRTPGIINEIGAVQSENNNQALGSDEQLLFVITMNATSIGVANFVADPADISPLHDTLTFEPPTPVNFDRIRYGFDSLNVVSGAGGGGGEGFHNMNNPYDVNADGFVSPVDGLIVINGLNNGQGGYLGGGGEGENSHRQYVDTNGDDYLTSLDALLVINYLNSDSGGSAEGEFSAILSSGSLAESAAGVEGEVSVDVASDVLVDSESKIGVRETGRTYGPGLEHLASTDSIFGQSDESLDDVIDQLAPEIEETWKKNPFA